MIRATILGCGSSGGVPRLGGHWGACDPSNPRNRRRRCSLLVERDGPQGTTRMLVDTGPDLVPQLTDAGVGVLDAVVWTHPHADHIHGIDDLRQIVHNTGRVLPGWADTPTSRALRSRFGYIFQTPAGSPYPPVVALNLIDGAFRLGGRGGPLDVIPFRVEHGSITALGLRISGDGPALVYLPDVKSIPDAAWPAIMGAELFICDALRWTPHPSHAHLDQALQWIERSGAPRAVITNMHLDMNYDDVQAATPDHVVPAHDGLVLQL
ncbi:MBL fold metallo-hydrolase [uncultured Paracoccus sp.]|uniref:MBL fold metallo-hydrolase n=1 Tax=uncultured Paracoccus sp. TaxID=189685 RepID=UPI0026227448|nr:MBL fold metallo-hydrolase [uncultured Paracoccus sp.]